MHILSARSTAYYERTDVVFEPSQPTERFTCPNTILRDKVVLILVVRIKCSVPAVLSTVRSDA